MISTHSESPIVLVVMGVSGSGKSTVAKVLADRLGWELAEGDEMHPPVNIMKMAAGTPLTDDDRWPWLAEVNRWIRAHIEANHPGVITCSALKRSYRDVLRGSHVVFVHLVGGKDQIARRLEERTGHFMPTALLDSQIATLEPLTPNEQAIEIPNTSSPVLLAADIIDRLRLDISDQPNSPSSSTTGGPPH